MLYTVVTQWDHHNKRTPAWSQRLRQDFASVYAAQNDVFSFLTNFFPVQGNPPAFVPLPAIRFSLHEGPRTTIYGISAAYQGGPFSAGCRSEVAARKSGDAMVASSAPDECTPFLLRFLPTIKRRMIIFSGVYRDACERASGQNETDTRGRRRRFGGWMRVARLRREKRGRRGRRTEEWHSLSVDTRSSCSFGKRIIPWPSTAGAEKGGRECKPFNGLCAGTLLRIPFFLRWITRDWSRRLRISTYVSRVQYRSSTKRMIVRENVNCITFEFGWNIFCLIWMEDMYIYHQTVVI